MLSVFPELLSYEMLGVSIIRISLGCLIFYFGLITTGSKRLVYSEKIKAKKYPFYSIIPWILGLLEILIGGFLIIGFLTQVVVLIIICLLVDLIFIESFIGKILNFPIVFYIFIMLISSALLFLGPGFWAIDLPL